MKVDIMVDCMRCGSQRWNEKYEGTQEIKFSCNICGNVTSVGVSDTTEGYDCHKCQSTVWETVEKTESHRILKCSECNINIEFWIRE